MSATLHEFETGKGHRLSSTLATPVGVPRGVALFAHCFTCTQRSKAATRIADQLSRTGIATLRFDFTGLGGSGGDFGQAGFPSDVDDIVAAADWLRATIGAPMLLIGHSLGGAAVLAAASRIPEARAIATIGAPSDVAHALGHVHGDLGRIEREGAGSVEIGGLPFTISAAFLRGSHEAQLQAAVAELRAALLVLHAPSAAVVGIDHARRLFDWAHHPKSFASLGEADHLLRDEADARYVADLIAAWVERYLPAPPEPPTGVMARNHRPALATAISAGRHAGVADEPIAVGGTDLGPTPYDLLLSALGACTAMTLRLVASREGIPLEDVIVSLAHERNHAHDGEHPDDSGAHLQAIHRVLTFSGNLSAEQRDRLVAVAARCPVHRTLTGPLHIHDQLADRVGAD